MSRTLFVVGLVLALITCSYASLIPNTTDPVNSISPLLVYPGTFVTFYHNLVILNYADVRVFFADTEALVASIDDPTQMVVRIPPIYQSLLLPIRIEVDYDIYHILETDEVVKDFGWNTVTPQPILGNSGPPITFFGKDQSTIVTSKKRALNAQGAHSILIINAYLKNRGPSSSWWTSTSGLTAANEKSRQASVFDTLVSNTLGQMSYGLLTLDFDYTDYVSMPEDDDYYFWRSTDITYWQDQVDNAPDEATKATAEAMLQNANDRQSTPERGGDMFYDGFKAAVDAGYDVDQYDGVMLNIATDFTRAASYGRWDQATEDRATARSVSLKSKTNVWYISFGAHWGRRCHEFSHAYASGDQYSSNGYIATGQLFDLMGSHNYVQLFSGYNMVEKTKWYSASKIRTLTYDNDYPTDVTVGVRAHGLTESTTSNVYHIIKVEVYDGLTYYVEVRQAPAPNAQTTPAALLATSDSLSVLKPAVDAYNNAPDPKPILFDNHIFDWNSAAADKSGVLITKVTTLTNEDLNQNTRGITLLNPSEKLMRSGEFVEDPANNLRFEITLQSGTYPARYNIRVRWTNAIGDPQGLFNLRIRSWDSNYQTNDIWVDSQKNGWDTYSSSLEAVTGVPKGAGDKPWEAHSNRLHAHIWNDGIIDATNVQITYYLNSPPGIGDNGDWVPHSTRFMNILHGSESWVSSPTSDAPIWTPAVAKHTCLRVQISAQDGETSVDDNYAQENIFNFDSAGSSPHSPIFIETSLKNPRNLPTLVRLNVNGVPPGWELTFEKSWAFLGPLEKMTLRLLVFTDLGRDDPIGTTPNNYAVSPDARAGACCRVGRTAITCLSNLKYRECVNSTSVSYFHPGLTCEQVSCQTGACCLTAVTGGTAPTCQVLARPDCLKAGGTWRRNAKCTATTCRGACCRTLSTNFAAANVDTGESYCVDNESKTSCGLNDFHLGRTCAQSICRKKTSNMVISGFIDRWDDVKQVEENRASNLAEHLESIGGISVAVTANSRATCSYITVVGTVVRTYIQVSNGISPNYRHIGVEMRKNGVTLCVAPGMTDGLGQGEALVNLINTPACVPFAGGDYEIYVHILGDSQIAAATCDPITVTCTNAATGQTCRRKYPELEECRFNPYTQRCTMDACPYDKNRKCVLYQRPGQHPYCACQEVAVVPCRYDARTQGCSRTDCPTDTKKECRKFDTPLGPLCQCAPKEITPCQWDNEKGACSRSDCPTDRTRKCVRADTTVKRCICQPIFNNDDCPCAFNIETSSCTTEVCPAPRGTIGYPCKRFVGLTAKTGYCRCQTPQTVPAKRSIEFAPRVEEETIEPGMSQRWTLLSLPSAREVDVQLVGGQVMVYFALGRIPSASDNDLSGKLGKGEAEDSAIFELPANIDGQTWEMVVESVSELSSLVKIEDRPAELHEDNVNGTIVKTGYSGNSTMMILISVLSAVVVVFAVTIAVLVHKLRK